MIGVWTMPDSMYMCRRKFYIPKKEIFRDYYRKDLTPSDYLLPCDYVDSDGDLE